MKWYKMVEVHGAYQHGRDEKIWLNSLHEMSNVRTNSAHYIDHYDTHMYQKGGKVYYTVLLYT